LDKYYVGWILRTPSFDTWKIKNQLKELINYYKDDVPIPTTFCLPFSKKGAQQQRVPPQQKLKNIIKEIIEIEEKRDCVYHPIFGWVLKDVSLGLISKKQIKKENKCYIQDK
jgi:hypothetical protein